MKNITLFQKDVLYCAKTDCICLFTFLWILIVFFHKFLDIISQELSLITMVKVSMAFKQIANTQPGEKPIWFREHSGIIRISFMIMMCITLENTFIAGDENSSTYKSIESRCTRSLVKKTDLTSTSSSFFKLQNKLKHTKDRYNYSRDSNRCQNIQDT